MLNVVTHDPWLQPVRLSEYTDDIDRKAEAEGAAAVYAVGSAWIIIIVCMLAVFVTGVATNSVALSRSSRSSGNKKCGNYFGFAVFFLICMFIPGMNLIGMIGGIVLVSTVCKKVA